MKCFKCGISGDKTRLFDAISEKGIVKVCKKCLSEDNLVLVKSQTGGFSELPEKKQTVYERLSNMSGLGLKDKESEKELLNKQETTLRDIVDTNFKRNVQEGLKPKSDLFDNFHWIIMRARRMKHISQRQLAEAIAEPEVAIKMAEKGILPEGDYRLINKFENYLGIKLMKKKVPDLYVGKQNESEMILPESQVKEKVNRLTDFDPVTTKSLTISDLQEVKKEKKSKVLGEKEINEEIKKGDLSENEINKILFKKE